MYSICPRCGNNLDKKIDIIKKAKIIYYVCYNCNWNDYETFERCYYDKEKFSGFHGKRNTRNERLQDQKRKRIW